LEVGKFLRHLAVDVDIQILALLHEQQLIDAVAQHVLRAFAHGLLELLAARPAPAQLGFDQAAPAFELARRDDLVVYFRHDHFDDPHVGGESAPSKQECTEKTQH
jgi:hypothetical protein